MRGLIARRQYRKLKMRVEAARLKEEEERALRQQMDKRKAREIAEMKYMVNIIGVCGRGFKTIFDIFSWVFKNLFIFFSINFFSFLLVALMIFSLLFISPIPSLN